MNDEQTVTSDDIQPIWTPSAQRVTDTRIDRLRRDISEVIGEQLPDTAALHEWSLTESGDFWDVVWDELGVIADRGDGPALMPAPAGADMRSAKFFPAAVLNVAENLLAGGQRPGAGDEALVAYGEDGVRRSLTWAELSQASASMAKTLQAVGVSSGDVVAAWMPNVIETVITMLAASSLGAVFTSTSPDFGPAGVLDRFRQVEPSVLVATDGYHYNGKQHSRLGDLPDVINGLPSLKAVFVHAELGRDELDVGSVREQIVSVPVLPLSDVVDSNEQVAEQFAPLPTDHPWVVLYSSGTTGVPKCITHRAGGLLLKHLVEHQLHCDIRPGDRVFYYTTCGWMMWNWLVSVLASGATAVLYDGSPFYPGPEAMWNIVEREQITLFGTSAKFIDSSRKADVRPGEQRDLSALRTICSTGSPLAAEGYEWVYEAVAADVHLASISGGTDICGCFVMGDPTLPVYAGQIQGPALGMAVDVWDSSGNSLRDQPGVTGELVCTQPFPSMPLGFVNDDDRALYTAAYFDRFDAVWAHGDFASWTEQGGMVIHGRSDATLNSGGVRIGTAEIYRQAEHLDEIAESLAVGQEWDGDTRIVLFVRLADGVAFTDELQTALRTRIRTNCSPRHVPAVIVPVDDLPRTRSGKLAELAVADVIHGRPVRNVEALANAESLQLFTNLPDLSA